MTYLFLQPIGIAAALIGLSAYLHKNQRSLKIQMGIASQVWAIYFLDLDLITASLVQVILGLRTWASICIDSHPKLKKPYIAIASFCFLVAMIVTWDGLRSLLPTWAAINSTYAYTLSNLKMRFMFLLSSCIGMAFIFVIRSELLFVLEIIGISLNLWSIWKILKQ
jgi:Bacterial inner membrane protein